MTTIKQMWWRCTGWPLGLVRYAWFKLRGVEICARCWDEDGAANPADPELDGDEMAPVCNPCGEAAWDQAHRLK